MSSQPIIYLYIIFFLNIIQTIYNISVTHNQLFYFKKTDYNTVTKYKLLRKKIILLIKYFKKLKIIC